MKSVLLVLLMWIPFVCWGQTATFCIDTLDVINRSGSSQNVDEDFKEMEWKINGKFFNYKSGAIKVPVNGLELDTLLYKQKSDSKWDTIVCNVREAQTYKFVYNACCRAFDVTDANRKRFTAQVAFKIIGDSKKNKYLGTLGETGIMVHNDMVVLKPECRSPMLPNTCQITFSEIVPCDDPVNCTEYVFCLAGKGTVESYDAFGYKMISNKLKILFMPLSNDPTLITYDRKTDKIDIE